MNHLLTALFYLLTPAWCAAPLGTLLPRPQRVTVPGAPAAAPRHVDVPVVDSIAGASEHTLPGCSTPALACNRK